MLHDNCKDRKKIQYMFILGKFDSPSYNSFFPDNGIALLAAQIKKAGNEVVYYDMNIQERESDMWITFSNGAPDIVGFKLFYNNIRHSILIADEIHKKYPQSLIIAGGPHITFIGGHLFKCTQSFELLIMGEGDNAINEVGEYVLGMRSIDSISNCVYQKNGRVIYNKQHIINDISNLPFPDWETIGIRNYFPILQLNMARGCPNQCSFCVHNSILSRINDEKLFRNKSLSEIHKSNHYRKREFSSAKNELEHNRNVYKTKYFVVSDSTPSKESIMDLCNYLINNNINSKWAAFAHVAQIDELLIRKMAEANCVALFLGIESGNGRLLKIIGKRYDKSQIKTAIKMVKSYGIDIVASFIMGHPGEDEFSINETKQLICDLQLRTVFMSPFTLEPGSPIALNPKNYDICLHADWFEKIAILPVNVECHEVYYYDINNKPNPEYWNEINNLYALENLGLKFDTFDNEYIKLLACILGRQSTDLYHDMQKLIETNNINEINKLIYKSWELVAK